jgi:hemoglobin
MVNFTGFSVGIMLSACASHSTKPEPNLYQRLGGEVVMVAVVDETVESVRANSRLNQSFNKVNIKRLKQKIVEQICFLTGGGCVYDDDDVKTVHAGLGITEREFYGVVEALVRALDAHNVGLREKNQLLAILAPMKKDIVTR